MTNSTPPKSQGLYSIENNVMDKVVPNSDVMVHELYKSPKSVCFSPIDSGLNHLHYFPLLFLISLQSKVLIFYWFLGIRIGWKSFSGKQMTQPCFQASHLPTQCSRQRLHIASSRTAWFSEWASFPGTRKVHHLLVPTGTCLCLFRLSSFASTPNLMKADPILCFLVFSFSLQATTTKSDLQHLPLVDTVPASSLTIFCVTSAELTNQPYRKAVIIWLLS